MNFIDCEVVGISQKPTKRRKDYLFSIGETIIQKIDPFPRTKNIKLKLDYFSYKYTNI